MQSFQIDTPLLIDQNDIDFQLVFELVLNRLDHQLGVLSVGIEQFDPRKTFAIRITSLRQEFMSIFRIITSTRTGAVAQHSGWNPGVLRPFATAQNARKNRSIQSLRESPSHQNVVERFLLDIEAEIVSSQQRQLLILRRVLKAHYIRSREAAVVDKVE